MRHRGVGWCRLSTQTCPAPGVEPGSTFWLPQSLSRCGCRSQRFATFTTQQATRLNVTWALFWSFVRPTHCTTTVQVCQVLLQCRIWCKWAPNANFEKEEVVNYYTHLMGFSFSWCTNGKVNVLTVVVFSFSVCATHTIVLNGTKKTVK